LGSGETFVHLPPPSCCQSALLAYQSHRGQSEPAAFRRKGTEPGVNEILFDASKVDLVGEPADRSVVELYIVADIPW
jgi:hypothetical protein